MRYIDKLKRYIDKRLTEINIIELVEQIGIPFNNISDNDIDECLKEKVFLATECIYDGSSWKYSHRNATYDLFRIVTIVNELNNNTYDYNYPIPIWDDSDNDKPIWNTDGVGHHHIRAFYHCKKNIYMPINRCGQDDPYKFFT